MRIALTAWNWNNDPARSLAALGAEVVGFTRWEPGLVESENHGQWRLERCPIQVSNDPNAEAWSFRESVLARARELGEFDIAHALDAPARPAALGLADRSNLTLSAVSVSKSGDFDAFMTPGARFSLWICDHPWTAERWSDHARMDQGSRILVPGPAIAPSGTTRPHRDPESLSIALWLPRESTIASELVTEAIELLGQESMVKASILGWGASARALRDRMALIGSASLESPMANLSAAEWDQAIDQATAVGVAEEPSESPVAWMAWLRGAGVFRLEGSSPRILSEAIRAAVFSRTRRGREIRVGARIAESALEPASVARSWMRGYLQTLTQADREDESVGPRRLIFTGGRTRLTLTPIDPWRLEAVWKVHADDLRVAMSWLGSEAPHAVLVIRLLDVSDIHFHGDNAHGSIDFEIRPEESRRILSLSYPGRSFAGCLGLKSGRGGFQPLAYADLSHLPKDQPAKFIAHRRLRALPRSTRAALKAD